MANLPAPPPNDPPTAADMAGIPITEVLWKDEGEADGVAIGPLWIAWDNGQRTGGQWVTKPDALRIARERGVRLVEV